MKTELIAKLIAASACAVIWGAVFLQPPPKRPPAAMAPLAPVKNPSCYRICGWWSAQDWLEACGVPRSSP